MTIIVRRQNFGLAPVVGGMGPRLACAYQSWTPRGLQEASWWANFSDAPDEWTLPDEQEDAAYVDAVTDGSARAFEIQRTGWFSPLEVRLRRIVTTLVALPLRDGAPAGPAIDISAFTDPFGLPLPHPNGGGANDLRVRWYLIHDTDRQAQALDLAVVLEHEIPRGVQLRRFPDNWGDFRYAWQSRYSVNHRLEALWDGFIRLFVVLQAPLATWMVRAGGLLNLEFRRVRSGR